MTTQQPAEAPVMVGSVWASSTLVGTLWALLSSSSMAPSAAVETSAERLLRDGVAVTDTAEMHAPAGALHSPMTQDVVEPLRALLARSGARKDAFVKIGDSNTVNSSFMRCFAGGDVRLGSHEELSDTVSFFKAHDVDGVKTSFDRVTEAATIGWLARDVMNGTPSALEREIAATRPAFAVIMLGTNDNRAGGVEPFAASLGAVVDKTLALGVVPLLSTIPPRTDNRAAAARVPELNAVIREIATARGVPLMDLYQALEDLPGKGLAQDGIHLQMAYSNAPHGCWLTASGLQKGMNTRNLLTLQALDRARRFLVEGETPEGEPSDAVATR
jgi:hypothetical protein